MNVNTKSMFDNELIKFCDRNELVISDITLLTRDSFTYVSEAHCTTSWLDHAICSRNIHSLIKHVCILDRPPLSDHLPLFTDFNIVFNDSVPSKNYTRCSDRKTINRSQASNVSIAKYKKLTIFFGPDFKCT